jgi:hypothetical protein
MTNVASQAVGLHRAVAAADDAPGATGGATGDAVVVTEAGGVAVATTGAALVGGAVTGAAVA